MSLKDKLLGSPPVQSHAAKAKRQHPKGWEPRVTTDGTSGEVVTAPRTEPCEDVDDLIREMGLDPENWCLSGKLLLNRWQPSPDSWNYQYKFSVVPASEAVTDEEFKAICKRLEKHKPKRPEPRPVESARVFCIADMQIGKVEAAGGKDLIADMVVKMIDEAAAICKAEKPDAVYLIGMGDIVEGCFGSYPSQEFKVDLDQSQQERFARRTILAYIKAIAPHTPRIIVGAVKGNHGAIRGRGGDSQGITNANDNRDILVFESVVEGLAEAPAYDHVTFVHPGDEIALTLDIAGETFTFIHGDEFGRGGTPLEKATNWLKGQAAGRLPPGDAGVIVWAHYHHVITANRLGRWFLQCPALDPGSDWYTRKTGEHSSPGMLSMRVYADGQFMPQFIPA